MEKQHSHNNYVECMELTIMLISISVYSLDINLSLRLVYIPLV